MNLSRCIITYQYPILQHAGQPSFTRMAGLESGKAWVLQWFVTTSQNILQCLRRGEQGMPGCLPVNECYARAGCELNIGYLPGIRTPGHIAGDDMAIA